MSRFTLYLALCWSVLVTLAWGIVPGHPAAGAWAVVAIASYVTVPLFAFFARGGGWGRYPSAPFRLFVVRPVIYAQLLLPIVAGAGVVGALAGALLGEARLGGRVAALVALLVAGAVLIAGWIGSRTLVTRDVEARVADLPEAFDGLRIVQASDLHLGPHSSRRFLRHVTRAVNDANPDLVVVTGDLVDDRAEDARLFGEWIETLGSPPHGVYLIPGNHDVYAGWPAVRASLHENSRAHVLVNDAQILTRGGALLALVGLGDPAGRVRGGWQQPGNAAPDVPRAFREVPRDVPVVAFAHNPALWPAIAERGAALTLSGHTHWGQFALPRAGWSLASPFLQHAMGAYQEGESLLYVHPGTGFWGIPFRIGALPEVTRVTLRRAERTGITMGAPRAA